MWQPSAYHPNVLDGASSSYVRPWKCRTLSSMTSGSEELGADHGYCRECGAPAHPSDKTCAYCRSPIATLRCAHCFGFNPITALHCSGCGERLGLNRIAETDASPKPCPDCGALMVMYRDDDGALWDCDACDAQFVEHRLLDSLLAGRQRLPAKDVVKPHPLPLDTNITYFPCPYCAQLMNRRNFGGRSGIVVDVCALHGVWFEAGELGRVLQFVESGGLAHARRLALGLNARLGPDEARREANWAEPVRSSAGQWPGTVTASEPWRRWVEARLEQLLRLYLSWSRR